MLDKILHELGWYKRPNQYVTHIEFGKFMIEGGNIVPSKFLSENDYIRIVGSKWNDGLHQYPDVNLTDETFEGAIWVMRVPSAVITLASKIEEYEKAIWGNQARLRANPSEDILIQRLQMQTVFFCLGKVFLKMNYPLGG